mmetsp:Transcript_29739/g.64335  ORF Transcript_29739/g.64335 Transcript_29739/m.64335 type:complete len:209 (+) Transcript_29739:1789-2415(+)
MQFRPPWRQLAALWLAAAAHPKQLHRRPRATVLIQDNLEQHGSPTPSRPHICLIRPPHCNSSRSISSHNCKRPREADPSRCRHPQAASQQAHRTGARWPSRCSNSSSSSSSTNSSSSHSRSFWIHSTFQHPRLNLLWTVEPMAGAPCEGVAVAALVLFVLLRHFGEHPQLHGGQESLLLLALLLALSRRGPICVDEQNRCCCMIQLLD